MGRIALCGLLLVGCLASAAIEAPAAEKVRPPLPKPKPVEIISPEPEMAEPEIETPMTTEEAAGPVIVLPREKPEQVKKPEPGAAPEAKPETAPAPEEEKPQPGDDFATCRSELEALGARFRVPEMPAADGQCKVPNPVRISVIETPAGKVDFPSTPVLNCVFAKRFTAWVSDIAAPVVKAHTGEGLAAIVTGPGYECRGRNGDTTTKISEHAFGNAVDIASFRLEDKESMPVANVQKAGHVESRWLMALRISACGYFTTVLGPGSNAAHAEHYHFDLGLHGKSGNYRICE